MGTGLLGSEIINCWGHSDCQLSSGRLQVTKKGSQNASHSVQDGLFSTGMGYYTMYKQPSTQQYKYCVFVDAENVDTTYPRFSQWIEFIVQVSIKSSRNLTHEIL